MNCKKKNIVFLLIMGCILHGSAIHSAGQESFSTYYLENLPQSSSLNPALLRHSTKLTLGVPLLSGVEASFSSSFSIADLMYIENKTLWVDLDRFIEKIPIKNHFTESITLPLLFINYQTKNWNLSLSVKEKQIGQYVFERSFIDLLRLGNAPWQGSAFSTIFDFKFMHYREYALGYSQPIGKNFRVGGTLKFLTGFAAVDLYEAKLKIETGPDVDFLTMETNGLVNFSMPIASPFDSSGSEGVGAEPFSVNSNSGIMGSYLMNFSNPGFAVDLGIVYHPSERFELSASISNLGSLYWKKDIQNLQQNGAINWRGIDLSQLTHLNNSQQITDQFKNLGDSLFSLMNFKHTHNPFTTSLSSGFLLGAKYQISKHFNTGLSGHIQYFDGIYSPALSLSGNATFSESFSCTANYSIIGKSFFNIGLGATVKLGPIQFFCVTGNVLALINIPKARYFDARFGINILLGTIIGSNLE